jgi:hypothetical protein
MASAGGGGGGAMSSLHESQLTVTMPHDVASAMTVEFKPDPDYKADVVELSADGVVHISQGVSSHALSAQLQVQYQKKKRKNETFIFCQNLTFQTSQQFLFYFFIIVYSF